MLCASACVVLPPCDNLRTVLSSCPINLELLKAVVAKLTELDEITHAQRAAINDNNATLVQELHERLQATVRAKERAVEAWMKHHREHGC